MSKEKQIEERCENCLHYGACLLNSEYVPTPCRKYEDKADWSKQSEGEWQLEECQSGLFSIDQYFVCSACKQEFIVEGWDYEDLVANAKYCPNCGAKMKGE